MGDIGLIDKDDSCLLPDYLIPDKCLLNTYLLNPIAGKDGIHPWIGLPLLAKFSIVRVGAYGIRPSVYLTSGGVRPLRGRLEGVCDTPLPWRIKNSNPLYLLNYSPGTFGDVCDTTLP